MSLTNREAQIVLGMIARGDKQHDIAAWFGENQARIAEVEKGSHGSLAAAAKEDLFPRGAPGPKGRRLKAFAAKALRLLEEGKNADALNELKMGINQFDKHEY
ncbi:MAG: hypothetical protein ACRCSU_17295 [Paracoccaceae bacterium]